MIAGAPTPPHPARPGAEGELGAGPARGVAPWSPGRAHQVPDAQQDGAGADMAAQAAAVRVEPRPGRDHLHRSGARTSLQDTSSEASGPGPAGPVGCSGLSPWPLRLRLCALALRPRSPGPWLRAAPRASELRAAAAAAVGH